MPFLADSTDNSELVSPSTSSHPGCPTALWCPKEATFPVTLGQTTSDARRQQCAQKSHKQPEKHRRSPSSVPAQTAKISSPCPASQAAPGCPMALWQAKQQPLPQSGARQDPELLRTSTAVTNTTQHNMAVPQLYASQEGQPLPAWANSGTMVGEKAP